MSSIHLPHDGVLPNLQLKPLRGTSWVIWLSDWWSELHEAYESVPNWLTHRDR